MEWQPIETAPKDGTRILVTFSPSNSLKTPYNIVWWGRFSAKTKAGDYYTTHSWKESGQLHLRYTPTHWMPLPQPPQQEAKAHENPLVSPDNK